MRSAHEELEKLPGYGRDINKSREEAKKLLKEAGVENLKVNFLNRAVGQPYTTAGILLVDQWKRIGVETEHKQLETKLFFEALGQAGLRRRHRLHLRPCRRSEPAVRPSRLRGA